MFYIYTIYIYIVYKNLICIHRAICIFLEFSVCFMVILNYTSCTHRSVETTTLRVVEGFVSRFPANGGRANSCYSESSPQVFTIPRRDNVTNTFMYELINTSLVAGFSCFFGSIYVLTLLFWGKFDHYWDMFVWSGLKPWYLYSLFLYWQYWHYWWKKSRKPVGIDKAAANDSSKIISTIRLHSRPKNQLSVEWNNSYKKGEIAPYLPIYFWPCMGVIASFTTSRVPPRRIDSLLLNT